MQHFFEVRCVGLALDSLHAQAIGINIKAGEYVHGNL
jgi:hypothetical protein